VLSHINETAARMGARPGMTVKAMIDLLRLALREQR
jgi:hypothetical protein